MRNNWDKQIFSIQTEAEFNVAALQAFRYQREHINVYRRYCDLLQVNADDVQHYSQIPFLPIRFFKSNVLVDHPDKVQTVFTSSGTTGMVSSQHHVVDTALYEQSFLNAFHLFYGPVSEYCVLALLPSYLEREGSSLVYMADRLIQESQHPASGFYLHNYEDLVQVLTAQEQKGQACLLLGVTYALLDLAEKFPMQLKHTLVMETGGMKGKRKELIREELHAILQKGLGIEKVHSEYGMTELLSQAYSKGDGVFETPPWMKVVIRDTYDPFSYMPEGRTGGINVIDLANLHTCSFIETADLGKTFSANTFTILGRFDHSDIRGCNLMVAG